MTMTKLLLLGTVAMLPMIGVASKADAQTAFDRACKSAIVAEKSYTTNNIGEVLVHMTAAFVDMANHQLPSRIDLHLAWEDMMTFTMQYDGENGKEALQTFIDDNCNE